MMRAPPVQLQAKQRFVALSRTYLGDRSAMSLVGSNVWSRGEVQIFLVTI